MPLQIKPTRSELIKLKKRIKLAKSGYILLKKKRDGLILEFFGILKKAKTIRQEVVNNYLFALKKINIARVIESDLKIKSIAMAIKERPKVQLSKKNIMGVLVPKIEFDKLKKHFLTRGYGIYGSSVIDEAAYAYEELVEKIVLAAELEISMKNILKEVEKTKRRVNALEFIVIHQLEKIKSFITLRLEEMERENIFRLKLIKKAAT